MWADIETDCSKFIQKYVESYPEVRVSAFLTSAFLTGGFCRPSDNICCLENRKHLRSQ